MEFKIPDPLKKEHEELHKELQDAIKSGGGTGEAARAVADLLHPHFVKEEEYAMPPLDLLRALAEGGVTPEMKDVIQLTDKLNAELLQMLEEHKAIVASLQNLKEVARKENRMEYVSFAEKLIMHAKNEEEVLYPASILVGKYLKQMLNK